MNIDTIAGEGTDLKGRFKESVGRAIGDSSLQSDGAADQVAGNARKAFGGLRDFARDRPIVTAGIAAVAGAILYRRLRRNRTR
jgi:uncharacterized protein YjbJ (UPF0337 family)